MMAQETDYDAPKGTQKAHMSKSTFNQFAALERQKIFSDFILKFKNNPAQPAPISSLINAFQQDKVYYTAEPWIDANKKVIANELLFRFIRDEDQSIGHYAHIEPSLHQTQLVTDFDMLNIFNILSWLPKDDENIHSTINFSHDTLCRKGLCERFLNVVQHEQAPSIIVEILENEKQFKAEQIDYLYSLKKRGVVFAMDDFRISMASDWARLQSLESKGILSYIKLDGKDSVRPYLDQGKSGLEALRQEILKIKNHAGSNPKIVAEWVNNSTEIDKLVSIGVDAVQGANLMLLP
jgi:EAL domain-containing protein (putative c-di-GMP-specific phosphodiesterase class I)